MFDSKRRAPCAWPSLRRWTQALVLALGVLVAGPPAFGQAREAVNADAPLGLDEALRLAQARSRLLPAQDAAAGAAHQMAHAAGHLPDPTLKASLTNLPIDGADRFSLTRDFMTMRSLGVMQEFTRAEKRRARSARFAREAEVAQAGREVALAALRRDTALAWFDRHYQQRLRQLLREQRAETALQIEAAEAAWRGGRGAQADIFAARSAVAMLDERILLAERQVATAKTQLARWVGADAERTLAAPPSLSSLSSLSSQHADDANLERHIEHHPQIVLLARQEAMARAEADIAASNKRSDWSVELMYSQRGRAFSNMISVNLSIPLQWDPANRQDRELDARLGLAEQVRAQREEAIREHGAEARTWLQQWQGNRDRLAQYDRSLVPLAGERTQAALATYRGGNGTLGAVLEARRMEIDTRLERLRLEMETAALWAQLEYLIPPQTQAAQAGRSPVSKEQSR